MPAFVRICHIPTVSCKENLLNPALKFQALSSLGETIIMAIDPQRFAGGPTLAAVVSAAISEVKSQKDEILTPGEPEYRMAAKRAIEGIPVEAGLWEEIEVWSTRLRIDPPCI